MHTHSYIPKDTKSQLGLYHILFIQLFVNSFLTHLFHVFAPRSLIILLDNNEEKNPAYIQKS